MIMTSAKPRSSTRNEFDAIKMSAWTCETFGFEHTKDEKRAFQPKSAHIFQRAHNETDFSSNGGCLTVYCIVRTAREELSGPDERMESWADSAFL